MDDAAEEAVADLDIVRMTPAIERYRAHLASGTLEFVLSQHDVPTYWIAALGCLGKEVADMLHGLRDRPDARQVFFTIVADLLARNAERTS